MKLRQKSYTAELDSKHSNKFRKSKRQSDSTLSRMLISPKATPELFINIPCGLPSPTRSEYSAQSQK